MDFVRKAVRAIGRCAIKVESAAERCVSTLVELIQTKVTYVVQEGVVVIKVRRITYMVGVVVIKVRRVTYVVGVVVIKVRRVQH